jgi:hypothetical protein
MDNDTRGRLNELLYQLSYLREDYDVEVIQRIAPELQGESYQEAWRIFFSIREIWIDMDRIMDK